MIDKETLQNDLCYLIGEWYLSWKSRITVDGGQHRLGVAKEDLKEIICEYIHMYCKDKLDKRSS
jgi:predicted RNase H-like nuclease